MGRHGLTIALGLAVGLFAALAASYADEAQTARQSPCLSLANRMNNCTYDGEATVVCVTLKAGKVTQYTCTWGELE